jgi:DNA-binding helix-hairpin-helix protein with protein kinase domain
MSSEELYEKQKNCDIFGLGTVIFELITKNSYCSVQDSF